MLPVRQVVLAQLVGHAVGACGQLHHLGAARVVGQDLGGQGAAGTLLGRAWMRQAGGRDRLSACARARLPQPLQPQPLQPQPGV
jgi:hypothetical protein